MSLIQIPQVLPTGIYLTRLHTVRDLAEAKRHGDLDVGESALLPESQLQSIGDIDLKRLAISDRRARKGVKNEPEGYTHIELKNYARAHKLRNSGSKEELLSRIRTFLRSQGITV